MSELRAVMSALEAGFDDYIEAIRTAIRIPSVSKTGQGLDEMAAWLVTQLQLLGAEATLEEGQIAPIVFGSLRSPGAKRTLLFYDLYDVQPADQQHWVSPPFAAEISRDGKLIGRGAFNSKGPLIGFLNVLRAFNKAGVELPVNLVFVIEGEEEIGSPSLEPFLRKRADLLRDCDAAFIPYLGTNAAGKTIVRLGFKGLMMLKLGVRGGEWGGPAERDIHAMHSGWLASPANELVSALASLQSRDGKLSVEGIASGLDPDPDDQALLADAASSFDKQAWLTELGARRFKYDAGPEDLLRHLLFDSTLNIDGMWVGDTPPGVEPPTHLAGHANAVLDLRLVPGMTVEATANALRRHLDLHGFGHVELEVTSAYPASKTSVREPVVDALLKSCRRHTNDLTVYPIHAGAAPMHLFTEVLGIPYAFGGVGHGANAHAPNEYLDVASMRDFMAATADFLFEFGAH
ncbi:MAG: M20/M25/M40 family metallo-hydrolase [Rhizobiaceae bacterium]|nr:M20/M25/M40 family metallo-hydrolase [Rhizobiaceae bacterium]